MEPTIDLKFTMCSGSTCCPDAHITNAKVEISEHGQSVSMTPEQLKMLWAKAKESGFVKD